MSRRWRMSDDIFLAQYHDTPGANFVAKHDLHFTGKDAGEIRMKKLKDAGVWDKILAHIKTHDEMHKAWVNAFGSKGYKSLMEAMDDD